MEIEDRYGDFQDLYYQASDRNLVIIDGSECGFIKDMIEIFLLNKEIVSKIY